MRLDLWLDIACLFKTRSEAQNACKNGKIDINGQPAKPHRVIKIGDEIVMSSPARPQQRLVVVAIAEKHLPKAEARELYRDLTPPPTPEEHRGSENGSSDGPFPIAPERRVARQRGDASFGRPRRRN